MSIEGSFDGWDVERSEQWNLSAWSVDFARDAVGRQSGVTDQPFALPQSHKPAESFGMLRSQLRSNVWDGFALVR